MSELKKTLLLILDGWGYRSRRRRQLRPQCVNTASGWGFWPSTPTPDWRVPVDPWVCLTGLWGIQKSAI